MEGLRWTQILDALISVGIKDYIDTTIKTLDEIRLKEKQMEKERSIIVEDEDGMLIDSDRILPTAQTDTMDVEGTLMVKDRDGNIINASSILDRGEASEKGKYTSLKSKSVNKTAKKQNWG